MFGPALEAALRPKNLTLRHFPQSFEFSTLGGWIATRAGGHYASLYTHIDDFVESARMMTPQGAWESRRLPGSGAGPSPDRMVIGSEGIFGIITEAWMRLQDRPVFKESVSVFFDTTHGAAECVRVIAQSGLFPSNCRLLDPVEARNNLVGDGTKAILVLGFESADHPIGPWMDRALELVADHGGKYERKQAKNPVDAAADKWRNAFIRMPYYRDYWVRHGMIADTFETAIPWSHFHNFYQNVLDQTKAAIRQISGQQVDVSCRLTHVYPDGAAPYFTYVFPGTRTADFASCLEQWRQIKAATNKIVVANGGTVTHHHAVGRDHRSGYDQQTPALYRQSLAAIKNELDPKGLLNPGVLIGE
jgi:alkyldihydroxyacetonephosphate synthase